MFKGEQELREFLDKYPNPKVWVIATIRPGYVSCIPPIPNICGAEVHVSPETEAEIMSIIRGG